MLDVSALSVAYGKHPALNEAALTVNRGEIVVILGANGAGKSTLLKAVSGICEGRVQGSVTLNGTELVGLPPHRIVEEGVALVPEGRGVFPDLTVQENLILGAYSDRAREDETANLERVLTLFPKLGERRGQVVRTMSGGEQQMVAIGRAMMSNPALLTLDEPSLGLSPLLCKELFQNLALVRETGIGILLVEQNAKQSLAIADHGYLLENTRIVHEGRAADLRSDPAVQAAYLGGGGTATGAVAGKPATPKAPRPAARPATGPTPSDIAAQALAGLPSARPRPAPTPVPEAKQPPAAQPAVQPAPPPRPAPGPQPAAQRSEADRVLGAPVTDMVARAADLSRQRGGTTRPARRPEATPHRTPAFPDLTAGSDDRLQSILAEIEEAAARARDWRPSRPRKEET